MNPREKNISSVKALLEKNVENAPTETEAMAALAKANELRKNGFIILPSGVKSICLRHDLRIMVKLRCIRFWIVNTYCKR